jgi:hypothetical protein
MKITKDKIRQIIKEELADLQQEMGRYGYLRKGDEDHSGKPVGGKPATNPYVATVRAKMRDIRNDVANTKKEVTDEDAQKIANDMIAADPNIDRELLQKAVEVALRDFRPLPLVKAYSDSSIKVNVK